MWKIIKYNMGKTIRNFFMNFLLSIIGAHLSVSFIDSQPFITNKVEFLIILKVPHENSAQIPTWLLPGAAVPDSKIFKILRTIRIWLILRNRERLIQKETNDYLNKLK